MAPLLGQAPAGAGRRTRIRGPVGGGHNTMTYPARNGAARRRSRATAAPGRAVRPAWHRRSRPGCAPPRSPARRPAVAGGHTCAGCRAACCGSPDAPPARAGWRAGAPGSARPAAAPGRCWCGWRQARRDRRRPSPDRPAAASSRRRGTRRKSAANLSGRRVAWRAPAPGRRNRSRRRGRRALPAIPARSARAAWRRRDRLAVAAR